MAVVFHLTDGKNIYAAVPDWETASGDVGPGKWIAVIERGSDRKLKINCDHVSRIEEVADGS